jgi:hypothetical protein
MLEADVPHGAQATSCDRQGRDGLAPPADVKKINLHAAIEKMLDDRRQSRGAPLARAFRAKLRNDHHRCHRRNSRWDDITDPRRRDTATATA